MTLNEFYFKWYKPHHIDVENRPGTVRQKESSFEKYILPMLGDKRLADFVQTDWLLFKNSLKLKQLSDKTIKNHQGYLRHAMNFAVEQAIIPMFPPIKSVRSALPDVDYLHSNEIQPLLMSAYKEPDRFYLMFRLALKTGMRIGELRGLRFGDLKEREVNGKTRIEITIQRSVPGRLNDVGPTKSGAVRYASIGSEFIEMLPDKHLPDQYVFANPDKPFMPLTYKAADCAIKRIASRANMRSIGWHTLRHTVATYLVNKKIPLIEVCGVLGHVDIRTTRRYVHIDASGLTSAFATLDHF